MKILFVGNNHTFFNDMPNIFKGKAKEDGYEIDVTMITYPGISLQGHLNLYDVRFNLLYGKYDYVIVQEKANPLVDFNDTLKAIKKIKEYADINNTKLVYYPNFGMLDVIEDRFIRMKQNKEIAKSMNAIYSPVDEKWYEAYFNNEKVYHQDNMHASLYGSTLIANTLWDSVKKDILKK